MLLLKTLFKLSIFMGVMFAIDRAFYHLRYPVENTFASAAKQRTHHVDRMLERIRTDQEIVDRVYLGSSLSQFGINFEGDQPSENGYWLNFGIGGYKHPGTQAKIVGCLPHLNLNEDSKIFYEVQSTMLQLENKITKFTDNYRSQFCDGKTEESERFEWPITLVDLLKLSNIFKYSENLPRFVQDIQNSSLKPVEQRTSKPQQEIIAFKGFQASEFGVLAKGSVRTRYFKQGNISYEPKGTAWTQLSNNIKLIEAQPGESFLIELPEYIDMQRLAPERYISFRKDMCRLEQNHKLKFFSLNSLEAFPVNDYSLFFDSNHLNTKGTELLKAKLTNIENSALGCDDENLYKISDSKPTRETLKLRISSPRGRVCEYNLYALNFSGKNGSFDYADFGSGEGMPKEHFNNGIYAFSSDMDTRLRNNALQVISRGGKALEFSVPYVSPLNEDSNKPDVNITLSYKSDCDLNMVVNGVNVVLPQVNKVTENTIISN